MSELAKAIANSKDPGFLNQHLEDQRITIQVAIWNNPAATIEQRHHLYQTFHQRARLPRALGANVYVIALEHGWDVTNFTDSILRIARRAPDMRKAIATHRPELFAALDDTIEHLEHEVARAGIDTVPEYPNTHVAPAVMSRKAAGSLLSRLDWLSSFYHELTGERKARVAELAAVLKPARGFTYPGMAVTTVAALIGWAGPGQPDQLAHAVDLASEAGYVDEATGEIDSQLLDLVEQQDTQAARLILAASGRTVTQAIHVDWHTLAWFIDHHRPNMFKRLWQRHSVTEGRYDTARIQTIAKLAAVYGVDVVDIGDVAKQIASAPYDRRLQTRIWRFTAENGRVVTNCPEGVDDEHLSILWAAVAASGRIPAESKYAKSAYITAIGKRIEHVRNRGLLTHIVEQARTASLLTEHAFQFPAILDTAAEQVAAAAGDNDSAWTLIRELGVDWTGTLGELCDLVTATRDDHPSRT